MKISAIQKVGKGLKRKSATCSNHLIILIIRLTRLPAVPHKHLMDLVSIPMWYEAGSLKLGRSSLQVFLLGTVMWNILEIISWSHSVLSGLVVYKWRCDYNKISYRINHKQSLNMSKLRNGWIRETRLAQSPEDSLINTTHVEANYFARHFSLRWKQWRCANSCVPIHNSCIKPNEPSCNSLPPWN